MSGTVVATAEWTRMTAAGQARFEAELRRAGLLGVRREVEAWLGEPYAVGDVVVQLVEERGRVWVHPPAVVVTEPVGRPRLQLLRRPADLQPVPIGMATASFRAARVPVASPLAEGRVTDEHVGEVLLGLFG